MWESARMGGALGETCPPTCPLLCNEFFIMGNFFLDLVYMENPFINCLRFSILENILFLFLAQYFLSPGFNEGCIFVNSTWTSEKT
jgi:hypothetical protein